MDIGFYIHWPKGSLNSKGNVLGDELIGESMCRALRRMESISSCDLYAPNNLPKYRLDVMIYLNDTPPNSSWAKKHLLYLQNAYGEGADNVLPRVQKRGYDGYAFISNKLLELHRRDGYPGIFLPFGVDTEIFTPLPVDPRFDCDVCYVGSDIKGRERSEKYLWPATCFDFALYGNWRLQYRIQFWKNLPYQRTLASLSRGKILQEDVPQLYSSAKMTLNCTAQDCVDWDVITLRTFEVLACKGFLITDRVPVAERELHDCVVFTDGGEDLREKIADYLERPAERERIAANGYDYVLRNATITSRMESLIAYLQELS